MPAPVTRTVTLDDLSPDEMAAIFAAWDGGKQAAFFGAVAREADGWEYGRSRFCMQALHIAAELDDGGRYVIERIADHAGLIPEAVAAQASS